MNKRISIILTLALALTLLCGGAQLAFASSEVAGTWYLNNMEMEGMSIAPASMGMEMTITLNEDNTALIQISGEEDETGTWTLEGDQVSITSGEETLSLTLSEGALTVEEDGMKMIFGQEKVEAEAFVAAPVRTGVALEDFDGVWSATTLDMMGMQMPVASMGMEMTLSIEGGKAQVTATSEGEDEQSEMTGSLADDVLTLSAPAAEGEDAETMALKLHEDGTMSYSEEMDGEDGSVTLYFQKVEAE